jgi:hypothetical protein
MIDANELKSAIRRIQWKPVLGSDDEAAVIRFEFRDNGECRI